MVANGKPSLSEMKAAGLVEMAVLSKAQACWADVYGRLRAEFGPRFIVQNDIYAPFDLGLAGLALDLETLDGLFAAEQVVRIEAWSYRLLVNPQMGDYSVDEVKAYRAVYQDGLKTPDGPVDAVCAVAYRLLLKWLGEGVERFMIEFPPILGVVADPVVNPMLVSQITGHVCGLTGEWRAISQQYELELEHLPLDLDWEAAGFFEQGCGPPIPPTRKTLLARLGFAAAPEGAYLVRVKGPWDGVREAIVHLGAADATRYSDPGGVAYGICVYERGSPKIYLARKAVWDADMWSAGFAAQASKVEPGVRRVR